MSVDLKRFVDINIKPHVTSQVKGTRDTVRMYIDIHSTELPSVDLIVASYANAKASLSEAWFAYIEKELTAYFGNGGNKLHIVSYTGGGSTGGSGAIIAELQKPENNNEIVVCFPEQSAPGFDAVVSAINGSSYGINEKIFVRCTNGIPVSDDDEDRRKKVALKYSATKPEVCMTIAAYLSQIDVYKQDSIYDYMFTQENATAETLTDTQYGYLIANNINVDITLANAVRNCGGNCKDGSDLVNEYCRIVLHQTLTDVLIDLLSQKIKNSTGLSKIYTVMCQELSKYVASGYLTTDKCWTDQDMVVTYNGSQYTIIGKGTALENGYLIKILPYESLTEADKLAHKTPPIYVVLASQYGIRMITVNGEVI